MDDCLRQRSLAERSKTGNRYVTEDMKWNYHALSKRVTCGKKDDIKKTKRNNLYQSAAKYELEQVAMFVTCLHFF